MLRLEGPTLPDETKGQVVPYYFGDHQDVPAFPLQVGQQASLAKNCGIDVDDTTLLLSGPNIMELLAGVPNAGVVQLEEEWISYSGKSVAGTALYVAERGYGTTIPVPHSKGTTVVWVESRPLYVVADMPPGCSYPPDAITDVRINDLGQVPFYTVRLRDERVVPGHPLVTIEFDLTRAFASSPPAATMPGVAMVTSIAGGSDAPMDPTSRSVARKRRRLARQRELAIRRGWVQPITGGAGVATYGGSAPAALRAKSTSSTSSSSGLRHNRVLGYSTGVSVAAPPPPSPPPPVTRRVATRANVSSGVTTPGSVAEGPATPVRFYQAALGRVTVDIRGLRDTPEGRYTGTPTAVLENPAPVVRNILESTYGETDPAQYDRLTWAATDARQRAIGLTWRLRWTGEQFATFRANAGYCGQADLYLDEAGRWVYRFRERSTPPAAVIATRELIGDLSLGWTSVESLNTSLTVDWGQAGQPASGGFTLENAGMTRRYGIRRARDLNLPYAGTETVARVLGRYWLSQWDRPKQTGHTGVTWAHAALTVTDRVFLESPVLELYGARRIPFEIRGITDRGGQRVLLLVESDPLAMSCPLSGSLMNDRILTAFLSGSVGTGTVSYALMGTLIRPRTYSRPLTGSFHAPPNTVLANLSGSLEASRTGTLAKTLGAATAVAAGTVSGGPPRTGTLAKTLGACTLAAFGTGATGSPPDGFVHGEPGSRIDY